MKLSILAFICAASMAFSGISHAADFSPGGNAVCRAFFKNYPRAYHTCSAHGFGTLAWSTPIHSSPVYGCDCPARDWSCLPTNPTCIE